MWEMLGIVLFIQVQNKSANRKISLKKNVLQYILNQFKEKHGTCLVYITRIERSVSLL